MNQDQFLDETVYDEDRLEKHLWKHEKLTGFSRRRLIQLMAGAAGAALAGFAPRTPRAAEAACTAGGVIKPTPPEFFRILGTNRETLWEVMRNRGYLTPNELFFVRNHTCTAVIDANTWRLRVEGSGVHHALDLSYDELVSMDAVSVTKFVECAGNGRGFFGTQQGTPASGTQWRLGAIGVAEWTGVPLWRVLQRAGLRHTAVDVMPEGLDDEVTGLGHVRRPLPIEKALQPDTLLVYAMNGQTLPPDHGFPIRLLVPGWAGIASIKWVGRLEVASEPLFSPWNTTMYRLFGEAYPDSPLVTSQVVKSAFELPFPATLNAGPQVLRGRAWSGRGKIVHVDVSFDGGAHWRRTRLSTPNNSQAWVRWSLPWDPQPGSYVLKARARDSRGNVQPATVPFNTQGYLFGAIVNHPVTVV
jgi:sulfane dehydrogenase subunit SoxC